jgi:hypothetical protein
MDIVIILRLCIAGNCSQDMIRKEGGCGCCTKSSSCPSKGKLQGHFGEVLWHWQSGSNCHQERESSCQRLQLLGFRVYWGLRLFMNVNFRLFSPRLLVVCCNQSCYITGDFGLVRKLPVCTNHLHTTLNSKP